MTHETDRIPVPINGKGPRPDQAPVPAPGPAADDDRPTATTVVFTPTQLAVGFGIIASLIVLLVGRMRRRGRSGSRGRLGRR